MPDDSALDRIKKRQLSRPQVPERGSPYEVNGSLDLEKTSVKLATTPTPKDTRKGGSLRIDATVSKTIRHICVDGEVTRETLIEALIEFYQKHPEAQPEILASARAKQDKRMEAANLKRRQAMLSRLQS
jgi:hypothetical protein